MSIDTMLTSMSSIMTDTLSSLDKVSLIDLLQHRTKLFLAATMAGVPDRLYIDELRSDVETLQKEIKRRIE